MRLSKRQEIEKYMKALRQEDERYNYEASDPEAIESQLINFYKKI